MAEEEICDLKKELKKSEEERVETDGWGAKEAEDLMNTELLDENATLRLKITALQDEVGSLELNLLKITFDWNKLCCRSKSRELWRKRRSVV